MHRVIFSLLICFSFFLNQYCCHASEKPQLVTSLEDIWKGDSASVNKGIFLSLLASHLDRRFFQANQELKEKQLPFRLAYELKPAAEDADFQFRIFVSSEKATDLKLKKLCHGVAYDFYQWLNSFALLFQKQFNIKTLNGDVAGLKSGKEIYTLNFQQAYSQYILDRQVEQIARAVVLMGQKVENSGGKLDIKTYQGYINILKQYVSQFGWLKRTLVGDLASHYAWLIVQHADFDSVFQKQILQTMLKLPANEIRLSEVAFLADRILVNAGKSQVYGTQFSIDASGNIVPFPIADMPALEERRAKLGLEPLTDYLEKMMQLYSKRRKVKKEPANSNRKPVPAKKQ
jgi:hypothetical protein